MVCIIWVDWVRVCVCVASGILVIVKYKVLSDFNEMLVSDQGERPESIYGHHYD